MKKRTAGIFALVLLSAGAYLVYEVLRTPYPEMVLPDNTLAYVRLDDLSDLSVDLQDTALWKHITGAEHREFYVHLWNQWIQSIKSASGVDPNWFFEQMNGDIAIAIFPLENSASTALFAQVSNEEKMNRMMEQKLDPELKRRVEDLKKTSANHGNESYYCYTSSTFPKEFNPCYFIFEGYLIVTPSSQAMNRILNVRSGDGNPLSDNALFRKARKVRSRSDHLFAFVNLKQAQRFTEGKIGGRWKQYWPVLVSLFGINSLQAFSYSSGIQKDGFVESSRILADQERTGLAKIYLLQEPALAEALELIPAGSDRATAGTLPHLSRMYGEIQAQLQNIMGPEQFHRWENWMSALKSLFEFDVRRDFLSTIGYQFAYSQVTGIGKDIESTKTEYFLALKLRKVETFQGTWKRLVDLASFQGGKLVQETYRGKSIASVQMNRPGWNASPSYYFENEWFYFATDSSYLKKSIDAQLDGHGIETTRDYQRVASTFPSRVNTLSYANAQTSIHPYAEMMQRFSENPNDRWIDRERIEKEFQDLAQNLYGCATYTTVDEHGMKIQSFSSIPSGFLMFPSFISYLSFSDADDFLWEK